MAPTNLILIGMPGSGKSTAGVLLAKALGYDFVDTDLLVQRREGALLQDLVNQRGVPGFLDLEQSAIQSLGCTRSVIATGGSCVCRRASMAHLKTLGPILYLQVPLSQLRERLDTISTRGIAMEPGQTLEEVYRQREPLYRRWADAAADCTGQSLEETVAALVHLTARFGL